MSRFDPHPCPYCNNPKPRVYQRNVQARALTNTNIVVDNDSMIVTYVQCNKCKARGPFVRGGYQEAIWLWNSLSMH